MTAHFTNLEKIKYIKYYNLLFHLLKAVHTFQLGNVSTIKSTGRTRLDRYYTILERTSRIGLRKMASEWRPGYKHDDASSEYHRPKAFNIINLLRPATVRVSYISAPQYIGKVREKMQLADNRLRRSGVTRHHSSGRLILRQKRIFGDLKAYLPTRPTTV